MTSPARESLGRIASCMLTIAGAILVVMATGCASMPSLWPARTSYDQRAPADAPFADGRDRTPTAKTLYALARLLRSQERSLEYEATLARITREHPRFMPAYCDLAEHQIRQHRLEDAMRTLRLGLGVSGRDPVLLNNLGLAYLMHNQPDEGWSLLAEAAGARPQNPRYRANLALALGLLGRDAEAKALFEQVVSSADASHNLEVVRKARIARASAAESDTAPPPFARANRPLALKAAEAPVASESGRAIAESFAVASRPLGIPSTIDAFDSELNVGHD